MQEAISKLRAASRVAVLTGAGISAESGIPTFRGEGGLWRNYRAEDLATPEAFARDPALVWEWYDWRRGLCAQAEPNDGHRVIAEMERHYDDFLLITQNVDDLHPRAGSTKLVEIHGNIFRARCTVCLEHFGLSDGPLREVPVLCPACGKLARPHIVWFGETYESGVLNRATTFLARTDVVLVVGTSGAVTTPVSLALQAIGRGAYAIEINPNESQVTRFAHTFLQQNAGVALPALWQQVREQRG
ncbi:MAG: NAD-dependent protein deacylase [Armatimonadetes bacterium CG17_big_fil_post_rev_8_21_14_2_50_66_6]|nr:MAG: NAD-dependent protein deacylase [Armatimonadetes bacterium CG17_big_fil_post_rev_8_21_14_2_50_66_6]